MSGTAPNNGNINSAGAIPVYIVAGVTSGGVTPKAATASTIATGGTSVACKASTTLRPAGPE